MTTSFLSIATCALALALAPAAVAQPSLRVSATQPRTLADFTDNLKMADGTYATWRSTVSYDPVSGEYTKLIVNHDTGQEVSRVVTRDAMVTPSVVEEEAALAIIKADPTISRLMSRSRYPVDISGGFPLTREEGHGCGPGSRCLQYDVMEIVPGQRAARRIRYVIVDLRRLEMFSTDFNADLEGNLANPTARQQSSRY